MIDFFLEDLISSSTSKGILDACAVGSVFGINKLLGEPMKLDDLIQFAMKGEFISSKSAPADNVASALHGGLILVNNHEDFKVSKLPAPENLYALVHHPLIDEVADVSSSVVYVVNVIVVVILIIVIVICMEGEGAMDPRILLALYCCDYCCCYPKPNRHLEVSVHGH